MHENTKCCLNSIEIGRAALRIALTNSRMEENKVKERLAASGIRSTAVDFGGEFIPSIVKVIERAVVAAQRQGLVTETHVGAGAVAGAAQISAFTGFAPKMLAARRPRRTAPAVCELEGPIITGPIISKMLIIIFLYSSLASERCAKPTHISLRFSTPTPI